MITDKERENHEELFKLMRENPDLPVVPMVDSEVVASGDYGYWMGSFGKAQIREYAVDDWYGDGCIRYRDEDEEIMVEGCAEVKYDGTEADYKRAEEEVAKLWIKAIIVSIQLPE